MLTGVSRGLTPVYLILSGRVNCILHRNVSFKSYLTGSYFGEIEVFKNSRRMFTVRAESPTKLAILDLSVLRDVFTAHPQSHYNIFKRSLQRYFYFRQSILRVEPFKMITMNDPFWDSEETNDEHLLHSKIVKWLEMVVKHREDELKNRYFLIIKQSWVTQILHPVQIDCTRLQTKEIEVWRRSTKQCIDESKYTECRLLGFSSK